MSPSTTTGLRERKRQSTSQRIQQAALDLFETKGFDETTVEEVAQAAEVSRTSVFRYFGSKDDIVFAAETELLEALLRIMRDDPDATLGEVIVRYAQHIDEVMPDLHKRAAVIARLPKLIERLARVRGRWETAVCEELGARRGASAHSLEDRVAAGMAMSALFVAFLDWATTDAGTLTAPARRAADLLPDPLTVRSSPVEKVVPASSSA